MTRFPALYQSALAPWGVLSGIFRHWHMGCILLLAGCFYVKPAWTPPVNTEPDVWSPPESPSPYPSVMVGSATHSLTVLAHDIDGDDVFISFAPQSWLDEGVLTADQVGDNVVWMRTALIQSSPELDGRVVEAIVTDLNHHPPITVSWRLEVEK